MINATVDLREVGGPITQLKSRIDPNSGSNSRR
jgi:hypothetical protein